MKVFRMPDAAIYRPWAWVQMDPSGSHEGYINHPNTGPDQKFSWLKDFRYSLFENGGAGAEFTIFDNRGTHDGRWAKLARENLYHSTSEGQDPQWHAVFQWGWALRTLQSTGSNSTIGSAPTGADRTPSQSSEHGLILSGAELEYVEGGVNYRFKCMDDFGLTQASQLAEQFVNVSFKEAVEKLIDILKERQVLSPYFQSDIQMDKKFTEMFDPYRKTTWKSASYNSLSVVRNWVSQIPFRQRPPQGEYITPVIIQDDITKDFHRLRISTSPSIVGDYSDLGEVIHVFPPDTDPKMLTTLSFRPSFAGNQFWPAYGKMNSIDNIKRELIDNASVGENIEEKPGGSHVSLATMEVDSSISQKERTMGIMNYAQAAGSYNNSMFLPVEAQVEILGSPALDSINDIGSKVSLVVWNPHYLDGGFEGVKWIRTPPTDTRYEIFKRGAIIQSISHNIQEGAYTTTLSLVPNYGRPEQESI